MKIFKWGSIANKRPVLGILVFNIEISNPLPALFKSICHWRNVTRLRYFYLFGVRFFWVPKRK